MNRNYFFKGSLKAEIQNQVFIYILSILILAGILLIGFKTINSLIQNQDNILLSNFEVDFKAKVSSISQQFGQTSTSEFLVPKNYKQICFLDRLSTHDMPQLSNYPIIKDVYLSNMKPNVFLIDTFAEEFFYVPNLVVITQPINNGFICQNISYGRFEIRLKGVSGRRADVYFSDE